MTPREALDQLLITTLELEKAVCARDDELIRQLSEKRSQLIGTLESVREVDATDQECLKRVMDVTGRFMTHLQRETSVLGKILANVHSSRTAKNAYASAPATGATVLEETG